MNDRFKRIFFNILFCLFGITICFFFKINSYADNTTKVTFSSRAGSTREYAITMYLPNGYRYAFSSDNPYYIWCNGNISIEVYQTWYNLENNSNGTNHKIITGTRENNNGNYYYSYYFSNNFGYDKSFTEGSVPIFSNWNNLLNYVITGNLPASSYDGSLNLDSMKLSSWNVGSTLGYHYDFRYKVNTTWSNPDITTVKVRVKGTRKTDDFLGNSSPYSFKFHGYDYANVNGDVVEIIATPYNSAGAYGNSLYSSFVYDNLHPLTYIWRKLFKTNDYDNTIEIPYTDPSGNDVDITLPVDGVTNNYTYNIKYNPQTEEITNQYLVDNYYTLVVDYPEDLSGNETVINETQNYINEYYTTNNYYQTTKDVDVDFDFDFGDISSNDAQGFKTQFDGFFDGLGNFIGKLAKLLVGLAPWLSPAVAVWIVAGFGFLVALLVLLLVIKLVSFVRSLLPF